MVYFYPLQKQMTTAKSTEQIKKITQQPPLQYEDVGHNFPK